jgi:hypothetical protein
MFMSKSEVIPESTSEMLLLDHSEANLEKLASAVHGNVTLNSIAEFHRGDRILQIRINLR